MCSFVFDIGNAGVELANADIPDRGYLCKSFFFHAVLDTDE